MQRRFTIIQGGLSGSADDRPLTVGPARAACVSGWRIVLRRPGAIGDVEMAAWQALAEHHLPYDPFAHPDYLLTTARHGARGADIGFAFAYREVGGAAARLGAVLPFVLPHRVWGGPSVRLWQPPLATRPMQPLVAAGSAPTVLEAILRHLCADRPRAILRLGRVDGQGDLLRALTASARLDVEAHPTDSVPAARIVAVSAREPEAEFERITAPEAIRDAVERFLLLDAERSRRPLIGDPGDAATVRVVTRLFAQRGQTCVELGTRDGALVSGAIRLGLGESQVLWRAVNLREATPILRGAVDVDIRLSGQVRQDDELPRPRLVTK